MYKLVRHETDKPICLVALRKRSVAAIWAWRHLIASVESEVKTAVGPAVTALARLLAGVDLGHS